MKPLNGKSLGFEVIVTEWYFVFWKLCLKYKFIRLSYPDILNYYRDQSYFLKIRYRKIDKNLARALIIQ